MDILKFTNFMTWVMVAIVAILVILGGMTLAGMVEIFGFAMLGVLQVLVTTLIIVLFIWLFAKILTGIRAAKIKNQTKK